MEKYPISWSYVMRQSGSNFFSLRTFYKFLSNNNLAYPLMALMYECVMYRPEL